MHIAPFVSLSAFRNMSDATVQLVTSSGVILPNTPAVVGGLWLASSAILTTYSTTAFLKYPEIAARPPWARHTPGATKKEDGFHDIEMATTTSVSDLRDSKRPNALTGRQLSTTILHRVASRIDRATLLTLFRFSGSLLLGIFLRLDVRGISRRVSDTLKYGPAFALPAFFLFVANYCNSIALNRVGVPLTYTSKCGIPLITVLFLVFLQGPSALPNAYALSSLVLIAVGILGASWDSPTFENVGFAAAMASTASQAALNIASKRAILETQVQGGDAQRCMVAVALILTLGLTAVKEFILKPYNASVSSATLRGVVKNSKSSLSNTGSIVPPMWLSTFAVVAYHMEYVLSFTFVRVVSPVTYGACDSVRRLAIIISGKKMFGGPKFSPLNVYGIVLALFGALCYSLSVSLIN
jgi:hypothetical protein